MLVDAGFAASIDARRGLDHGAWVPMRYLKPDADVPVFQVSLPHDIDAAGALRLGQALAPLRERGVLVIGSGSLTHNLYEFRQHIRDPEYAQAFADWVADAVRRRDVDALVRLPRTRAARRARASQRGALPAAAGGDRRQPRRRRRDAGRRRHDLRRAVDGFVRLRPAGCGERITEAAA